MARASEGVPYYLHLLAGASRRRHAGDGTIDVEAMVSAAIDHPDDPWHLKHYVPRLGAYYGDEAPAAGAILDVVAGGPVATQQIRNGLAAQDLEAADLSSLI